VASNTTGRPGTLGNIKMKRSIGTCLRHGAAFTHIVVVNREQYVCQVALGTTGKSESSSDIAMIINARTALKAIWRVDALRKKNVLWLQACGTWVSTFY
jgi:hypothetical protein